jgi:hypothetical protein
VIRIVSDESGDPPDWRARKPLEMTARDVARHVAIVDARVDGGKSRRLIVVIGLQR